MPLLVVSALLGTAAPAAARGFGIGGRLAWARSDVDVDVEGFIGTSSSTAARRCCSTLPNRLAMARRARVMLAASVTSMRTVIALGPDPGCEAEVCARLVDPATADAWFAQLRSAVPWRSERRLMYEREVDVPRLMGHFRLDPTPASTRPARLTRA